MKSRLVGVAINHPLKFACMIATLQRLLITASSVRCNMVSTPTKAL